MTEMVRLDRLAKRFGPVHAVEEVSFAVARGEVLGFLGPNGAGKSTTMRMVTGFIPPSSGTASVMGFDVVRPADRGQAPGRLPARGRAALRRHDGTRPSCASSPRCAGSHGEERTRRIDAAIARTAARGSGAPADRDPVQGLQAPRRPGPGHHARSARAGARRADRRPRSEPEAWGAAADRRDGRRQGDHHLHPHPGGGRRDLHPRRGHRPRTGGGRRAAGRARSAARGTTTRCGSPRTPTCSPSCSRCWRIWRRCARSRSWVPSTAWPACWWSRETGRPRSSTRWAS